MLNQSRYSQVVETLANQLFQVRDAGPGLDHVFLGVEVKRSKGGFVPKAKAREIAVRKLGTRLVATLAA